MSGRAAAVQALLICTTLTASGCGRNYAAQSPAELCTSAETVGRIKQAVFAQAAEDASSETRYALRQLSDHAQARLVEPVVQSYDHDTKRSSCAAKLALLMPFGVLPRDLRSSISYVSQPTADGRGLIVSPSGFDELAAGIARSDLGSWAAQNAPRKPGLIVEVASADTAPLTPATHQASAATAPPPGIRAISRAKQPLPVAGPLQIAKPKAGPTGPRPVSAPRAAPVPGAAEATSPEIPMTARAASRPMPRSAGSESREARLAPTQQLASQDGPVRVFVHIADRDQLATADDVRARLNGLSIAGQPVDTPDVRFVPSLPRQTQVRCLKRADCLAARRVARYLAGELGQPVAVIDMSETYEKDPSVRQGSLELWLRPPSPRPGT